MNALVGLARYLTRPEFIGVLWVSCAVVVCSRLVLGRPAVGILINALLLGLYAAFFRAAGTPWSEYLDVFGLPAAAGTGLGLWLRVVDPDADQRREAGRSARRSPSPPP